MFDEFEFFDTEAFDSFVHDNIQKVAKFAGLDEINNYEIKRNRDGNIELIIRGPHGKVRYLKGLTDKDIEKLGKDVVYEHAFAEF